MKKKTILIITCSIAVFIVVLLFILLGGNSEENNYDQEPNVSDITQSDTGTESIPEQSVSSNSNPAETSVSESGLPGKKEPEEVYDIGSGDFAVTDSVLIIPEPEEKEESDNDFGIIPLEPDKATDDKDEFELPEI